HGSARSAKRRVRTHENIPPSLALVVLIGPFALRIGLIVPLLLAGLVGCNMTTQGAPLLTTTRPAEPSLEELATIYVRRGAQYPQNPAVRAQAVEACARVLGQEGLLLVRE